MLKKLALALCLASALPAPASALEYGGFALARFAEDTYFDVTRLTIRDASDVILGDMPEAACVFASKLLNAHGAFTACVPQEEPRR